jgi:hypothetical protein
MKAGVFTTGNFLANDMNNSNGFTVSKYDLALLP